jgi:hypothetical protein
MRQYRPQVFLVKCIGLIFIVTLTNCKNENTKNAQEMFAKAEQAVKQDSVATLNARTKKLRNVFYNVPSALEIGELLKESGAGYSETYPNDPTNIGKYSSQKSQAINLGIYAADLSYAGVYEQKEEAMLYLKCANQLATALGIPNAFNDQTITRLNSNMDKRDSLLSIVTQDYWNTDSYLKNSDRQEISALIMAGGWIEGLFLATQVASHSKSNTDLINRVAEQKMALGDLIEFMNTYPDDAPGMAIIKNQLKRLDNVYAGINVENKNANVSTDDASNSTTLGGEEKVMMTDQQFKSITDVTATVRNEIIHEN